MIERIQKALQPTKHTNMQLEHTKPVHETYELSIAKKNYKFKNRITNDTTLDCFNTFNFLYVIKIIHNCRFVFTVEITNRTRLTDFITFLRIKFEGNEFSFIQIDDKIYHKDQELIRESLGDIASNCSFINSDAFLDLNYDTEFYFYNGSVLYTLKVEKVHVIYKDRKIFIREYFQREVLCKACTKNVCSVLVVNDPILPCKDKNLCFTCFKQLFIDENGNLKYEGMSFDRF